MRLLIAEDERDLAEALSVFFEKNQFTVDTVSNGLRRLRIRRHGDYDAIVLDVMMPKLSGVEVLERLRAEGVRTPVMMLTAKAEKDDRITASTPGRTIILPKPFAPDELICRVRAMLRRGRRVPARRCLPSATRRSTAARVCSRARGRACA